MVDDLRLAQNSMRAAARELEEKAALLTEKTDYYASVLREVQAAVLAVSDACLLEACNPAAERLFALVERDSVGLALEHLLPKSFYTLWLDPLLKPLTENETQRVEGDYSGRIAGSDYQLLVAFELTVTLYGQETADAYYNEGFNDGKVSPNMIPTKKM